MGAIMAGKGNECQRAAEATIVPFLNMRDDRPGQIAARFTTNLCSTDCRLSVQNVETLHFLQRSLPTAQLGGCRECSCQLLPQTTADRL
jgi:hypothetical protein